MWPSWFKIAMLEYGEKEIPGPGDNKRITQYFTAVPEYKGEHHDSVAHCAAFVNWCLARTGVPGTGSALARSFTDWGIPVGPVTGSVVVFWRDKRDSLWGHCGFLVRELEETVYCLGANQDNSVNITGYAKNRLLGYRWPNK